MKTLALAATLMVLVAGCVDGTDPFDDASGTDPTPTDRDTTAAEGNQSAPPSRTNQTRPGSTAPPDEDTNGTDSGASSSAFAPGWPPLGTATIRPGVNVVADGQSCTANFLYRSADNRTLFLGLAAHCVAKGAQNNVNGCDASNEPFDIGTEVDVQGASKPGILVYTSWGTMQAADESNTAACRYNDFALVALDPADRDRVHPAVRHFGGPVGLADSSKVSMGTKVISYGNSALRFGFEPSNPHEGYVLEQAPWTITTATVSPGIPGDSGSGFMTGSGFALGVLSTVEVFPKAGTNGVSALDQMLSYAGEKGGARVQLVTWELLESGLLPG